MENKTNLDYSDNEEDLEYREENKKYEKDNLKVGKEQQINMVVADLVKDLKLKQIDFEKHFGKADPITDAQFITCLKKAEFEAKSEQLELLRMAFKADEGTDKISLK